MSESVDRKKLVEEKIRQEEEDLRVITEDARQLVAELLEEKGYLPEEIEKDREFIVAVSDREEVVSTDYILRPGGRPYAAIKCSMALDSRERHILSFSRVVDSSQIPVSIVTDGIKAHILDTNTGRLISESIDDIPPREEALKRIEDSEPVEKFPKAKLEMEKRVLLAFECASCPPGPGAE
jgi:hypothetical protein